MGKFMDLRIRMRTSGQVRCMSGTANRLWEERGLIAKGTVASTSNQQSLFIIVG
jgi:hypothetical protein